MINVFVVSESDHDRMNPISLLSFRDHVMKMHADDNKAFEHEYQVYVCSCWMCNADFCCHPVVTN